MDGPCATANTAEFLINHGLVSYEIGNTLKLAREKVIGPPRNGQSSGNVPNGIQNVVAYDFSGGGYRTVERGVMSASKEKTGSKGLITAFECKLRGWKSVSAVIR